MAVSLSLQRIYASAPVDDGLRETLELSHPQFLQSHYITNEPAAFTATLETGATVEFAALPFAARLPGSNAQGQQDLQLVIDNVDREIIEELERAATLPTERITVTYRAYAASDLTQPGATPIALSITSVSAGVTTVEANAGRTDVLNKRFPAVLYDVQQFPGLDR